jgi:hypothetical protein
MAAGHVLAVEMLAGSRFNGILGVLDDTAAKLS